MHGGHPRAENEMQKILPEDALSYNLVALHSYLYCETSSATVSYIRIFVGHDGDVIGQMIVLAIKRVAIGVFISILHVV